MDYVKSMKRLLKRVYYYGHTGYCPNCGSSLRKWIACGTDSCVAREKQIVGAGRREKGCPVCLSAERDRLVYLYVRDYLHLFESKTKINILHIAPEAHLYPVFRRNIPHEHYICGDKFEEGYTYGRHVQPMDITSIEWASDFFHLIICNHVLEHVPDDRQAMRELYRVLKPGGKAILQVPISLVLSETFEDFSITSPAERERVFGQHNHCRIYGQDYGKRLEEAGFTFRPVTLSDPRYRKYGLDMRERVLLAEKHLKRHLPSTTACKAELSSPQVIDLR
ncbi:MAG: methyltransferase domain-containing protein [Dysgonamonadaceae bacterium]|jgi:SAM-dependent methyltransferase|nr:methyltransferase domain-containing protein [Dysgonamonadaceae bacterium]